MFKTKVVTNKDYRLWTEYFTGSEASECCLLISGAAAPCRFWTDAFCKRLAETGLIVIRFDHRDTGLSSSLDNPSTYNIQDMVADCAAILDAYQFEKAHIVGHSMGGAIAQLLAIHHPERVQSLSSIGMGTAGPNKLPSGEILSFLDTYKPTPNFDESWPVWVQAWVFLNGGYPLDEEMARDYTKDIYERSDNEITAGRRHLQCLLGLPDLSKQLTKIQAPTLLIHGEEDSLIPPSRTIATSQAMGKKATLLLLPQMGHMIFDTDLQQHLANILLSHFEDDTYKPIQILSYKPHWAEWYEEEKTHLQTILTSEQFTFHHVGSTSIPEMYAKPILDILIEVPYINQVDSFATDLEENGYQSLGPVGINRHRFFQIKYPSGERESTHLHFFEKGSIGAQRMLRFRDYLRTHREDVRKYSTVKLEMAKKHHNNKLSYLQGKAPVVSEINEKALEEYGGDKIAPSCYNTLDRAPSESELEQSVHDNLVMQMSYFSIYTDAIHHVPQRSTISIVYAPHYKDDTFNTVTDALLTEDNAIGRIQGVIKFFRKKQLPFSWWVGPKDTPQNLPELLQSQGFTQKETDRIFYRSTQNITPPQTGQALTFTTITAEDQLRTYCELLTEAGIAKEVYDEIYRTISKEAYIKDRAMELYLGYLDDTPVCTGMLFFHAGVAGIYNVVTSLKERRKGFATQMMFHLLQRAQEAKYPYMILTGSEASHDLYSKKIECQRLGTYTEYTID